MDAALWTSHLPEEVQRLPQEALLFLIGEIGGIELDRESIHILKRSWPGKRKKRGGFPRLGKRQAVGCRGGARSDIATGRATQGQTVAGPALLPALGRPRHCATLRDRGRNLAGD